MALDKLLLAVWCTSSLSLLGWLYLATSRGGFWRVGEETADVLSPPAAGAQGPGVVVVVPARNEAQLLERTLPSLLSQKYPGSLQVVLVDDRSEDGTGRLARRIGRTHPAGSRLQVVEGRPVEPGWTGKLWALEQGIRTAADQKSEFLLLTDADILHPPGSVARLVDRAVRGKLDLISRMVHLRAENFWERLLIPAFVFFFAKLYPFAWVNAAGRKTAAAAGGCLLVRRRSLARTGGLRHLSGALIDDCALAAQIKAGKPAGPPGHIELALSRELQSLRSYHGLQGIWQMVSRTAYTQLRHSPLLLLATIGLMLVLYGGPPLGVGAGLAASGALPLAGCGLTLLGLCAWGLMSGLFLPFLRWYRVEGALAFGLPLAGLLYTLMTLDSARQHWRGDGGRWKGRVQGGRLAASESAVSKTPEPKG